MNSFSEELAYYWLLAHYATSLFLWKKTAFTETALNKLVRRNYGRKSPVSIKHQSLHSFKGMILLCQSILETRQLSNLHGPALFTIHQIRIECILSISISSISNINEHNSSTKRHIIEFKYIFKCEKFQLFQV